MFDTHAHLNFKAFNVDRDEVIKRALENNIRIINVGVDWKTSQESVELAERYPEKIFAAVGLHPNSVNEEEFDYEKYKKLAQNEKVVAIGEIGLDYYHFKNSKFKNQNAKLQFKNQNYENFKNLQKQIFIKQLELAKELNKTIIIHCREAHEDVLNIIFNFQFPISKLKGVIHSFSGNIKQAEEYRRLGFKIAFNGIITFTRDYDEVIVKTPLEDILLETDCPFLAPVPYRGQRNEPSYIIEIAKKLAEIKNISLEEVIKQTSKI